MIIAMNIGFGWSKEYIEESVHGLLGGCHWVAYKIFAIESDLYNISYMTYIVFIVSYSYFILILGNLPSRPDRQLSSTLICLGVIFRVLDSRGREGGHELRIPELLCCGASFTCWSILGVCSTWFCYS